MAMILSSDVKAYGVAILTQWFVTEFKANQLSNIEKKNPDKFK